jgi:transcriptional regulator with XRE-family HTH domain
MVLTVTTLDDRRGSIMTLAKRIRDCRYAKGWGPDELASRAEISRTALYQIECGKTETPRAGTLRRIARALDVSIDVLLGSAGWEFEAIGPMPAKAATAPTPAPIDYREPVSASYLRPDAPPSRPILDRLSPPHFAPRPASPSRESEVERKLRELLASPLGESVARIVEESHRLLPALRMA